MLILYSVSGSTKLQIVLNLLNEAYTKITEAK
jgi:hypothetical protein